MAPSTKPSRFFGGREQALPNPTRAKTQRVQNANPRFITTPPSLDVDPVPTHRAVCRPIFFNRIRDKKQTHELPGSGSISFSRWFNFTSPLVHKGRPPRLPNPRATTEGYPYQSL